MGSIPGRVVPAGCSSAQGTGKGRGGTRPLAPFAAFTDIDFLKNARFSSEETQKRKRRHRNSPVINSGTEKRNRERRWARNNRHGMSEDPVTEPPPHPHGSHRGPRRSHRDPPGGTSWEPTAQTPCPGNALRPSGAEIPLSRLLRVPPSLSLISTQGVPSLRSDAKQFPPRLVFQALPTPSPTRFPIPRRRSRARGSACVSPGSTPFSFAETSLEAFLGCLLPVLPFPQPATPPRLFPMGNVCWN